jgi:phosphinothricin acetyltransferase
MLVRPATTGDAAAFAAIYAPIVEETPISFETAAPGPAEMAARIARILRTHPWLAAEENGEVAGYAYASPHRERAAYRWSVDVAVYVRAGARRRGAARALYARLLEILTAQGFHRAFAGISLPNPASVAFHEAMGFEPVGVYRDVGYKAGAWRDVGWWGRPLALLADPPAEPLPFPALADI